MSKLRAVTIVTASLCTSAHAEGSRMSHVNASDKEMRFFRMVGVASWHATDPFVFFMSGFLDALNLAPEAASGPWSDQHPSFLGTADT